MVHHARMAKWAELVSSVVLGVYITVSNTAFRHIALKLTDWENHRTDPQ
jgi:Calcium-activated chloride channel